MYKELEIWKAIEKIYEALAAQYPPSSTECGGDFKEFECRQLNNDADSCRQYMLCLACQRVQEISDILDENKIHISALEAEKDLNEKGRCC